MTFFTALFSGKLGLDGEILNDAFEKDDSYLPEFLNDNLKKLSDIEQYGLEQKFSLDELEQCVKNLPKHKSPGIDGLPFELYKSVFPIIQKDYLAMHNCVWERERLRTTKRCS